MGKRWNQLWMLALAVLLIELAAFFAVGGPHRPLWGDEHHIIPVVRELAHHPSHIADYREVTPPLTYLAYGWWGLLFGFTPAALSSLSILLAVGTSLLIYRILSFSGIQPLYRLLLTLFLVVNPYFAGVGIYVYTDMLFLLLAYAASIALLEGMKGRFLVFALLALLVRQYAAFLLLAAGMYGFIAGLKGDRRELLGWWGVSLAAFIPLAALMVLWKGMAPPSGLAFWVPERGSGLGLSVLSTLLAFGTVYALPFFWLGRKQLGFGRLTWLAVPFALLLLVIAPIRASHAARVQLGISTVGLLHKTIVKVLPWIPLQYLLFVLLVIPGLLLVALLLRSLVRELRAGSSSFMLRLDLLLLSFLLVMSFSYQNWEKYLLPALPLIGLRLLVSRNAGRGE